MTERQRVDETSKIIGQITRIVDGLKTSDDYDEISKYLSVIKKFN